MQSSLAVADSNSQPGCAQPEPGRGNPGYRFAHPGSVHGREIVSVPDSTRAAAEPAPPSAAEKLIEAVKALHPDEMSPREALEALYALKAKLPKP
jgi:hypothetical protein